MFTGIVETLAQIISIRNEGTNRTFVLKASIQPELKIDQSVSHNGVCLTVDALGEDWYSVTAIQETLQRTNLGEWKEGDFVNLERCMRADGRLDGHFVQGHVDTTGTCESITDRNGSWEFVIRYEATEPEYITVPKGSITVNGTSLTVVKSETGLFSIEIIPYTYENTVFRYLKQGQKVNLEFDILGKYLIRYMEQRNP
ncbi:MAG: riboflavin synthase [Bacteroidia bacterium]|nr:riboflavin synthase [Bacteroidia bacterium]